jgi:hypothetical protein
VLQLLAKVIAIDVRQLVERFVDNERFQFLDSLVQLSPFLK